MFHFKYSNRVIKWFRPLSLLLFFFLVVIHTGLAMEKTVTISTLTDFPPNCFKKPNGVNIPLEVVSPGADSSQLRGFSWDVVRESFHASGYTIRLIVAPWSRSMFYVNSGKADLIFPAIRTQEREARFDYSTEPVDQTNIVIYVKRDKTIQWNNFEVLKGKRIASVRDWSYGERWESMEGVIIDQASTLMQGFYMLDNDRVFGVIGYEDSFDFRLKQENSFHKYAKSPVLAHVADYIIGLKSDTTKQLLIDFDKGKRVLLKNGQFKQIWDRWANMGIIE